MIAQKQGQNPQSRSNPAAKSPGAWQGDKLLAESLGSRVTVFYNDTFNSVSFKTGRFLDFDSFSIKILEEGKSEFALIPRQKCIRIELGGEKLVAARTR